MGAKKYSYKMSYAMKKVLNVLVEGLLSQENTQRFL